MEIRQSLEQRQQLILTQQLKQSIDLLQCTRFELIQQLHDFALENPMLDVKVPEHETFEKATEAANNAAETEPKYEIRGSGQSKDESKADAFLDFYREVVTLKEFLLDQWGSQCPTCPMRFVGDALIESIDDDGYFRESPQAVADHLHVSLKNVLRVLSALQQLGPPGMFARDLKECLLLQLDGGEADEPARVIVRDHLEDLAQNRLEQIAKKEHMTIETVAQAAERIRSLNPRPGNGFASSQDIYNINVDAVVEKIDGVYVVTMDDNIPTLFVNPSCKKLLDRPMDEASRAYLEKKLRSAEWLVQSIEQRQDTIRRVIECIVRKQVDFLDHGVSRLVPMRLIDVAEELELHESTVSRATRGTYIDTPQGILELKSLFTSGLGDEISPVAIKAVIEELIEAENKKKPLSDSALQKLLEDKGMDISRRTVAKYRDELGIPSSSRRRCHV